MGPLWQDTRYALRILRKNPGFTATVILLLALGIGVNAAIYTIVDAVLLQPLPGHDTGRLVRLYSTEEKGGTQAGLTSYPMFQDYRKSLTGLSDVAAYRVVAIEVAQQNGIAQRVAGEIVTGNFFDVLKISPRYGRLFSASDDGARGANPVAVLSERFWKEQFDGRPNAVHSILRINGQVFTIVGVAPDSLQELESGRKVWIPMSMAPVIDPVMATQIDRIENDFFKVVGRLKEGVSLTQAQAELSLVSERLGAGQTIHVWEGLDGAVISPSKKAPDSGNRWEETDWKKPWAMLAPLEKGFDPGEGRLAWLLVAVAAMILLIATADVAGLLLARSEHEEKELAIRASLGASGWALLRQRIVQGLLLAVLGGIVALFTASWSEKLLLATAPEGLPLPVGIASSVLSFRVVSFVLAISCLAGIAFSVLPALKKRPLEIAGKLKRQFFGRQLGSQGSSRVQSALVVSQIAASVVLLVGAGLLIQTMRNVARLDLGFDTEHVLSASLDLARQGYTKEQGATLLVPLLEKARSLPGVQSAAIVGGQPVIWRPRNIASHQWVCDNLPMTMVSPGYFRTLRIPLAQGRDFTAADAKDAPGVAIVNQAAAKLCWPNQNPMGKSFPSLKVVFKPFEIIGIAENVRVDEGDTSSHPQVYAPIAQFYDAFPWQFSLSILVSTSLPPHALVPALSAGIHNLDANLLLYDVLTPREFLSTGYRREQFFMRVLVVFGLLAVVLAISGLYGLLAYATARRTKEFGIRMALGAQPHQVFQMVLAQGGALTAVGVVLGLLCSIGATRLLQSVLFGVSPTDIGIFTFVGLSFFSSALLACFLPARRATAVDPMVALRDE